MTLFHPRLIKRITETPLEIPDEHAGILNRWADSIQDSSIYKIKETALRSDFIHKILAGVLGYDTVSSKGTTYSLAEEYPLGSGSVDVAFGTFDKADKAKDKVLAPFELKGAKTKDLDAIMPGRNKSPVQQAWEYGMDAKGAKWVLVTNYTELRLYAIGYGRKSYESFDFAKLSNPVHYTRFVTLLSKGNLLGGHTFNLLKESEQVDKDITNDLYDDYKALRARLIKTIGDENPEKDPLDVIRYTQTILDRILFIAFAEDKKLLPDNTLQKAYETKNPYNPQPVWENFKGLFHAINKGNKELEIPGYNGGLFADDQELDSLKISDALCEGFKKIGEYDFDSDVSVNILGHIFEQSISDLEELRALAEEGVEEPQIKTSKRKKDGIFYTPAYITRYIVEQTVGGWLSDRRLEIGFDKLPELTEKDYESITPIMRGKRAGQITYNKKIEKHIEAWEAYKKVLSGIKVIDPACGSGAFLNEVFDYLYREGQTVNNELAMLKGGQIDLFRWDTHILANNIYGVDLNSESVEIAKLSLWLKTANRREKLTYLEDNVRVGNSLIDDPNIVGEELAFNWNTKFSEIIKAGGFDVIVGNPPYGATLSTEEKAHIEKSYPSFKGNYDIYSAFIDKAFAVCKEGGYWGYITPVSWQSGYNYLSVRQALKEQGRLITGIKLPYDTFADAYVDTGIYIIKNEQAKKYSSQVYDFPIRYKIFGSLEQEVDFQELPSGYWQKLDSLKIVFNPNFYTLSEKAKKVGVELDTISDSVRGILADKSDILEQPEKDTKPYFIGSVYRYELQPDFSYVRYGENLKEKPKDYKFFAEPRILIRRLISRQLRVMAVIAQNEFVNKKDLYNLIITDKEYEPGYVLAIINSKLTSFLMTKGSTASTKDDFSQITLNDIRTMRVPAAPTAEKAALAGKTQTIQEANRELYEHSTAFCSLLQSEFKIEKLGRNLEQWYDLDFSDFVKEIEKRIKPETLSLQQKSEWLKHFEAEKAKALALKNTVIQTDRAIDTAIYQLYSLSDEEIELVEETQ